MNIQRALDDKIVVFGMSCVGKTTFAKEIDTHHYYCFDSLFQWHIIETFDLSIKDNLLEIQRNCDANKFVIDGWSLADQEGKFMPLESKIYVVYATYDQVVSQYRVKVYDHEEYRGMYRKWYDVLVYDKLPDVRYFHNIGEFVETDYDTFLTVTGSKTP